MVVVFLFVVSEPLFRVAHVTKVGPRVGAGKQAFSGTPPPPGSYLIQQSIQTHIVLLEAIWLQFFIRVGCSQAPRTKAIAFCSVVLSTS